MKQYFGHISFETCLTFGPLLKAGEVKSIRVSSSLEGIRRRLLEQENRAPLTNQKLLPSAGYLLFHTLMQIAPDAVNTVSWVFHHLEIRLTCQYNRYIDFSIAVNRITRLDLIAINLKQEGFQCYLRIPRRKIDLLCGTKRRHKWDQICGFCQNQISKAGIEMQVDRRGLGDPLSIADYQTRRRPLAVDFLMTFTCIFPLWKRFPAASYFIIRQNNER